MARVPGKGTLLKRKVSGVYVTVAQIVSLDGPDASVATVNATELDSTSEQEEVTMPDLGSLTGKAHFDPTDDTHLGMLDLIDNPNTDEEWQLVRTLGDPYYVKGPLKKFKTGNYVKDGLAEAEFEIKINEHNYV